MKSAFKIRQATPTDVPFVALVMAEAVGLQVMDRHTCADARMGRWMQLCEREDTLYSYRHAILVVDEENQPVAGLISYPGEGYLQRRNIIFGLVHDIIDFNIEEMDIEAHDGEYYLDSLAVLPAFRGQGIGSLLLEEGKRKAHAMGRPAVLACSPHNVLAHQLYERLGFRDQGEMFIFGDNYLRMVAHPNNSNINK